MKKCAVINDLSGFGKCSLTAAIPIISATGSEVHPLVTAVLSNQTAYESFRSQSLTDTLLPFIDEWKKLGAEFDAILTGFVTDERQLDIINTFADTFKTDDNILIVDPVMADNGSLYDGYTPSMCNKIRSLCKRADIITPNVSELCILADEEPAEDYCTICRYAQKIMSEGAGKIVVTGYKNGKTISNIVFDNGEVLEVSAENIGGYYSGTGDIFVSILTGGILKGMPLYDAVSLAAAFIEKVIKNTAGDNREDGIEFEKFLGELI